MQDDLISRQDAIDAILKADCGCGIDSADVIRKLPTADVVPMEFHDKCMEIEIEKRMDMVDVVRCKDCKHRDPEDKKCDCGHNIRWQLPRQDDWFCADGERKSE